MSDHEGALPPELGARLQQLSTPALADTGHDGVDVLDASIKPVHQACGFVGTARTVEMDPEALWIPLETLETAEAGDVIVIDAGGMLTEAVWGNLLSTYAVQIGVRAVVTNGAVRDVRELRTKGFPAFAKGTVPSGPSGETEAVIEESVMVGEVSIDPGQILVGDEDGVVVIAPADLEDVVAEAQAIVETEAEVFTRLTGGEGLRASMETAGML